MDDIIKQLARQRAAMEIANVERKPEPPARPAYEPREYGVYDSRRTSFGNGYLGAERLGPMTRITESIPRSKPIPNREPDTVENYLPADLSFMLSTPVKRSYHFSLWLEIAGFPTDLHEKHDPIFGMVFDAYMAGKKEAYKK